MSKTKIIHLLKVVFVIIVIVGLLASYVFTGAPRQQPAPYDQQSAQPWGFDGPTDQPSVTEPGDAPSQTGPSTPPPAKQ